jgi:hypothetical protein
MHLFERITTAVLATVQRDWSQQRRVSPNRPDDKGRIVGLF